MAREGRGGHAAAKIIEERQPAAEVPPAQAEEQGHANRPPAARVSFGGVQASIWANHNDKGEFHTVTFGRRYKEGDEWKTSNSYGPTDLLALQKVADLAVNKIIELSQARARSAA